MSASILRHRPIFGGVFGRGRYALATKPCTSRGLHSVRFMVIDPHAGAVLSVADDKQEALAAARRVIRAADTFPNEPAPSQGRTQAALWPDEELPPISSHGAQRRPISKRKREVFAKSAGKCHYCSSTLTLDGKWHVEHMLPRALDGSDDLVNLVAACVPCNLSKRDTSAIEFVAKR